MNDSGTRPVDRGKGDDQMEAFGIIIVPRYKMVGQLLKKEGKPLEVMGENRAINLCHKIYREQYLHKVLMVNEHLSVVFKIERRCKCTNIQHYIDGDERCMDCNTILPKIAKIEDEVNIEELTHA